MATMVLTESGYNRFMDNGLHGASVMKKVFLASAAAVALGSLGGCGTTFADRTLSGAMIGAGTGAVAGPVGVGTGAVVGGVVGAVTPPKNVNLGRPIWDR
jgi:hypothetical protein